MRKGLTEAVEKIVADELIAANAAFPAFNSRHEGYAVMLEEAQEARDEMQEIGMQTKIIWDMVKENAQKDVFLTRLGELKETAQNMAAEAIQLAAMSEKFIQFFEGRE